MGNGSTEVMNNYLIARFHSKLPSSLGAKKLIQSVLLAEFVRSVMNIVKLSDAIFLYHLTDCPSWPTNAVQLPLGPVNQFTVL